MQKAQQQIQGEMQAKALNYERLRRELKYGKITKKRHETSWKNMLLKIALPKLKNDLEFAWNNFERIVDAKDFTISLLIDELQSAEKQYRRNIDKHIDNIDQLIILCHDQITGIRDDSNNIISKLYDSALNDKNDLSIYKKENEDTLKTMLFMIKKEKQESDKMLRYEYNAKQDFELDYLNDLREKLTDALRTKYDRLYQESQEFLMKHIKAHGTRRKEYYELSRQDIQTQKMIRDLWTKYRQSLESLKHLKATYGIIKYEQTKKITSLKTQRDHFEFILKLVQKSHKAAQMEDEKELLDLTLLSNNVTDYLTQIASKGDKILRLMQLCRKLELQSEKFLAFPTFTKIARMPSIDYHFSLPITEHLPNLKLFFNRVAEADVVRFQLIEELQALQIENENLKKKLHEYCLCLTCE